jgi:ERF superfamily
MNEIINKPAQAELLSASVETSREVTAAQPHAAPAVIAEGPGALLGAIVQLAKDPAVDVTKLQALLTMQERMEAKEAERQFNQAFSRLPSFRVKKNGTIDLTSKEDRAKGAAAGTRAVPFAKWEDMSDVIDPFLKAEGFRLIFNSAARQGDGGGLTVTGFLLHSGGHSMNASMPLPLDTGPGRNNLQAYGSTLSYGKRYTAEMLLNIVREGVDDDGKRGGTKFIAEAEAAELRALLTEAKRQEGPFLDKIFSGTVRSFEEIERGSSYLAVKNTLEGIKFQQNSKAT